MNNMTLHRNKDEVQHLIGNILNAIVIAIMARIMRNV